MSADSSGGGSADELTGDSEAGSGSETSSPVPDSCEAWEHGDPDAEMELCLKYYGVLGCCVPDALAVGAEPWHACKGSFHFVGQGDGAPAPPECVMLMTVLIECAIATAGESCAEFEHFLEGLSSGTTGSEVGPPTDATMPCYAEVISTWDGGCQPYLY